jgi:hypothetical protein
MQTTLKGKALLGHAAFLAQRLHSLPESLFRRHASVSSLGASHTRPSIDRRRQLSYRQLSAMIDLSRGTASGGDDVGGNMKRYMRQVFLGIVVVATLAACGKSNVAATQTRTRELTQIATLTAPTAVPTAAPQAAGGSVPNSAYGTTSQGGVGNRWQTWHGLPLPEYFQVMQERPSVRPESKDPNDPKPCTETYFSHGLSDTQLVQQQIAAEWRRAGFVSVLWANYYIVWSDGTGRKLTTNWGGMKPPAQVYSFQGFHVWDCPN